MAFFFAEKTMVVDTGSASTVYFTENAVCVKILIPQLLYNLVDEALELQIPFPQDFMQSKKTLFMGPGETM